MTYKAGYIVGSIASGSINRILAENLVQMAPEILKMEEIVIDDLPFYSYDNDGDMSAEATRVKEQIESCDAVLIVTPEYNRSIPGVLKNALDTISRPWGQNSLNGKPGAIIGASIGTIGTALAQSHLRSVMSFLNVTLLGQEAYIALTPDKLDQRRIVDESMREFLTQWMHAFADHVAHFHR